MKTETNKNDLYKRIDYLESENQNLKKILRLIFSAKTFRIWQMYCFLRDNYKKIFLGDSSLNISYLYKKSKEVIKDKINPYISYISAPKLLEKFNNVSIVIPTYNGAQYFPTLIKAIKMQSNIIDPEIIFVDSESADKTLALANYYGVKVIDIKKKNFNHGLARNLGAKNAKGKYIIFTVQDAIPIDNFTYANMLSILVKNKDVVGISTKQTPYPDGDLFAKWQIYNHNNALKLNDANFICSLPEGKKFFNLPFIEKRKISLYDDVCSCVKKKEFLKLGAYKKINFAEDIEFSIRALSKGYKIAFTGNSGVIHSHNRSTEYFFHRYYADNKIVNKLLREKSEVYFQSLSDIIQYCFTTYFFIYKYIISSKYKLFMPDFGDFIKKVKRINLSEKLIMSSEMLKVLKKFSININSKVIEGQNYNFCNSKIYELFKNTHNEANNIIDLKKYDIATIKIFVDKIFTAIVGKYLTDVASKNKQIEKNLDVILMKGV